MNLLIVRHAIAFARDTSQWPDDRNRPLSPEGERKLMKSAQGLARLVKSADVVLSSPWKRAWQTAKILHETAGWPTPTECPAMEGDRSPRGVTSVLKSYSEADTVVLVGHQPHVGALVSYLLTGDAARVNLSFKKAGAVMLEIESSLRAGTATLVWSLPPKVLRWLA